MRKENASAYYRTDTGRRGYVSFETRAKTRKGIVRRAKECASMQSLFELGEYFTPEQVEWIEVRMH